MPALNVSGQSCLSFTWCTRLSLFINEVTIFIIKRNKSNHNTFTALNLFGNLFYLIILLCMLQILISLLSLFSFASKGNKWRRNDKRTLYTLEFCENGICYNLNCVLINYFLKFKTLKHE